MSSDKNKNATRQLSLRLLKTKEDDIEYIILNFKRWETYEC